MIKENFGKDLFVKQVQAPWPKPNEIDQEYCDRDYDDCSNRAEPFKNSLKHVLASVLERLLNYDGAIVHFGFKSLLSARSPHALA